MDLLESKVRVVLFPSAARHLFAQKTPVSPDDEIPIDLPSDTSDTSPRKVRKPPLGSSVVPASSETSTCPPPRSPGRRVRCNERPLDCPLRRLLWSCQLKVTSRSLGDQSRTSHRSPVGTDASAVGAPPTEDCVS